MCLNVAFPPVAPSEPVGVAMASKHVGSQLIELSLSDKDFIAVSEEVSFTTVDLWFVIISPRFGYFTW